LTAVAGRRWERLRVSEATVRRGIQRGILPARGLSTYGPYRIPRAAVNKVSGALDREAILRGDE
jgi:hypothetical protein